MAEIELIGHWSEDEARRAIALVKALGVGDGAGIPDDLVPYQISPDPIGFLSERQKKLMELLRKGSEAIALDDERFTKSAGCAQPVLDWAEYGSSALEKSLTHGAFKIEEGVRYQLNPNRRWERVDESAGITDAAPNMAAFDLPMQPGEFGYGVYLPVLESPMGAARLRVSLGITPEELISDEQFYELEESLTDDLDTLLTGKGVRAIARTTNGRVDLLFVRDNREITPMGWINEGTKPEPGSKVAYRLVSLQPQGDMLTADLEMVAASSLQKAAGTLKSTTLLHGAKLIPGGEPIDRSVIREAIARCKLDGVPVDSVDIRVLNGRPDFLPSGTVAFSVPIEKTISFCPTNLYERIALLTAEIIERLKVGVSLGAIAPDDALNVAAIAATLTPQWYVESLVKRLIGTTLLKERGASADYAKLLLGRGWQYWGTRKNYEQCISEDFRCAYDPMGLPNLMTMEWDLAVPGLARMAQTVAKHLIN